MDDLNKIKKKLKKSLQTRNNGHTVISTPKKQSKLSYIYDKFLYFLYRIGIYK